MIMEFMPVESYTIFEKQKSGFLKLDKDFPEAKLFGLLFHIYGYPNSCGNINGGDPNAPIKWAYTVKITNSTYLEILRMSAGIEIAIIGTMISSEKIENFLLEEIDKNKEAIDKSMEHFEKYKLLVNPYMRHKKMADKAFSFIDALKISELEPVERNKFDTEEYLEQKINIRNKQLRQFTKEIEDGNFFASVLLTESTLMVEAYLNVLFSLFRKQEFKSNTCFSKFMNQKIKDKFSNIFKYCICYNENDCIEKEIVDEYQKNYRIRSKIFHSDTEPDNIAFKNMMFYKKYPILEKAEDYTNSIMGFTDSYPSSEQAINAYKLCVNIIEKLQSLMLDEMREWIVSRMQLEVLGWNDSKKVYSIPFEHQLIEIY